MTEYRGDGLRAVKIQEARAREVEDAEIQKKKLVERSEVKDMANKFSATYDSVAVEMSAATVGLVTIHEMKRTQEMVMEQRAKKLVQMEDAKKSAEKERIKAKKEKKAKELLKQKTLSFNPDGEDEETSEESVDSDADFKRKGPDVEEEAVKRKRFGMNPDVATKFLPDRERDQEEILMRERLRLEWERRQRGVREEEVDIVYSYWDGSGHKKTATVKKGNSVYQFLCKALDSLRAEFSELKIASGDDLMFVKDDLIIPQTNTFYDFIVTQARGKGGLLFNFDQTPEALELVEEAGMHVAKVIHRSWYTRNKHIFPANRWEPFDPTKGPEDNDNQDKESSILTRLAGGAQIHGLEGCRAQCKCTTGSICEMHYKK